MLSRTVPGVFWWYWSLRQRLMLLAAVLLPVLGFFAFRVLLGDGAAGSASSASEEVEGLTATPAPKSELLVIADDDMRSAARIFPKTFGDFGEGSIQTKNMVFPGMNFDEYSVYLFFHSVSEDAEAADTTVTTSTTPTDDAVATSSSVPSELIGTTIETAREGLRWHFTERGAAVRAIESRNGVELFVAGLEGSRGYQGTLRFQAVPGGVVVRGVIKEIPANEVNDIIAESQATAPGAGGPAEGVVPPPTGADGSAVEPSSTTVPVTGP